MQHRQALVSLLSTLTPALSGHAHLLEQLQETQLGLNTLSHVPQPWADRLAHLVSKYPASGVPNLISAWDASNALVCSSAWQNEDFFLDEGLMKF